MQGVLSRMTPPALKSSTYEVRDRPDSGSKAIYQTTVIDALGGSRTCLWAILWGSDFDALREAMTPAAAWTELRAEIERYRDIHNERAGDLMDEGKGGADLAYARADELDKVLALMAHLGEGGQ